MAGLMGKKMKPEEASPGAAAEASVPPGEAADPKGRGANPADSTDDAQTGGEPATPAEEQAMASVLNAALAVLYGEQSHDQILQTLKSGSRPDTALADVASSLMLELDTQAKGQVPETVILPAAMAILSLLAELAQAAGVFEVDDNVLAMAAQQTTLTLMQEYGANPQDVQALIQQLGPDQVKAMVAEQQQLAGSWAGGQPGAAQGAPQPPMTEEA